MRSRADSSRFHARSSVWLAGQGTLRKRVIGLEERAPTRDEMDVMKSLLRSSFEAGASIFIPKMTWHAFENPEHELLLLWMASPPGLESFFRETCSPPGAPPKGLTREQIREVARKYGTAFR